MSFTCVNQLRRWMHGTGRVPPQTFLLQFAINNPLRPGKLLLPKTFWFTFDQTLPSFDPCMKARRFSHRSPAHTIGQAGFWTSFPPRLHNPPQRSYSIHKPPPHKLGGKNSLDGNFPSKNHATTKSWSSSWQTDAV